MGRGAATTRHQWIPLATILACVVGVTADAALAGCGPAAAPPSSNSPSSSPITRAHNQADIAFAQGMIPHHTQAVTMAWMAVGRAGSPRVQGLAEGIRSAQQREIDQMKGWLDAWNVTGPSGTHHHMGGMGHGAGGAMPGMVSSEQMNQLGQLTGAAFDRMFLQMMTAHHQGAVMMSRTELDSGQDSEARQFAQHVIDAQQREITEMRALLGG